LTHHHRNELADFVPARNLQRIRERFAGRIDVAVNQPDDTMAIARRDPIVGTIADRSDPARLLLINVRAIELPECSMRDSLRHAAKHQQAGSRGPDRHVIGRARQSRTRSLQQPFCLSELAGCEIGLGESIFGVTQPRRRAELLSLLQRMRARLDRVRQSSAEIQGSGAHRRCGQLPFCIFDHCGTALRLLSESEPAIHLSERCKRHPGLDAQINSSRLTSERGRQAVHGLHGNFEIVRRLPKS